MCKGTPAVQKNHQFSLKTFRADLMFCTHLISLIRFSRIPWHLVHINRQQKWEKHRSQLLVSVQEKQAPMIEKWGTKEDRAFVPFKRGPLLALLDQWNGNTKSNHIVVLIKHVKHNHAVPVVKINTISWLACLDITSVGKQERPLFCFHLNRNRFINATKANNCYGK